jgi:alpha-beta hydrolase superfamily lysophospholipase
MKHHLRILLSILGLLLMVLLVGPLLVPVPPLKGEASTEQLADPDSQFTVINGLRVHYKTAGQGKPALILLHGFGASLFSWREVFAPLMKDSRVVAFDRPAFGLTDRPLQWEGQNPYRPEASVDLTIGLMDHLDLAHQKKYPPGR